VPCLRRLFVSQPLTKTVCAGSSAAFSVTASGSPSPTFQWFKNGTNLAGATTATLTIPSATADDAGTYVAGGDRVRRQRVQ